MKKLLATLLAIVMAFGSFSMVSFAAEAEAVPAEKRSLNVTEVVLALVDLIKGEDAGVEFTVGDVINTVIAVSKGDVTIDLENLNVGGLVDTVMGLLSGDEEEETFKVEDILEIVQAIANGEGDINGDGALTLEDLISFIEEKVVSGGEQDQETAMITTIIFTVMRIVFKLISKLFSA